MIQGALLVGLFGILRNSRAIYVYVSDHAASRKFVRSDWTSNIHNAVLVQYNPQKQSSKDHKSWAHFVARGFFYTLNTPPRLVLSK